MIHKQALNAYLSGLTTKKNEKEIWWFDKWWGEVTVEPISETNYIIRGYYDDGSISEEVEFDNDMMNGMYRCWYSNGQLCFEEMYKDGERNGKSIGYTIGGNIRFELFYHEGKKV